VAYDINGITPSEREVWMSEYKKDYSVDKALLPMLVSQKGIETGFNVATFTIAADDGIARGRTREGNITYRRGGQSIVTMSLEEAVDGTEIPNFQAFKSSVDQREIMYMQVRNSIKRSQNSKVLDILADATYQTNSGNAQVFSANNVDNFLATFRTRIKAQDGEIIGLLSEHAHIEYERQTTVSSRDYVNDLKLQERRAFRHRGVLWVPFPEMPGAGTATETCYIFHQSAIEYHCREEPFHAFYSEKDRKYMCNGQVMQAGVIALTKGVTKWVHNGTTTFS
jgi:hypothetical protein